MHASWSVGGQAGVLVCGGVGLVYEQERILMMGVFM